MDRPTDAALRAPAVPATPAWPAFTIIEPLRRTAALVFASPHSGRRYPPSLLASARAPMEVLRRSEDAYVDELFAGAATHGAPVLCASHARAYVDVNRAADELDPAMYADHPAVAGFRPSDRVRAGLGVIHRLAADGREIYAAPLPYAEAQTRLEHIHRPYHAALAELLAETRALFGCAVLIDCHSMPTAARGPGAPDVVLGDRFGAACSPAIMALLEGALKRMGYRVARNAPFAGGHTTQAYGQPAGGVHAVQIELNRGLYLNERTLERTRGYVRVRADMTRLAEILADAALHRQLV